MKPKSGWSHPDSAKLARIKRHIRRQAKLYRTGRAEKYRRWGLNVKECKLTALPALIDADKLIEWIEGL